MPKLPCSAMIGLSKGVIKRHMTLEVSRAQIMCVTSGEKKGAYSVRGKRCLLSSSLRLKERLELLSVERRYCWVFCHRQRQEEFSNREDVLYIESWCYLGVVEWLFLLLLGVKSRIR